MSEVWTAQGVPGEEGGWLVGGIFSSLNNACEFAEEWASRFPGFEVYVYKRTLDHPANDDHDHEAYFVSPVISTPKKTQEPA